MSAREIFALSGVLAAVSCTTVGVHREPSDAPRTKTEAKPAANVIQSSGVSGLWANNCASCHGSNGQGGGGGTRSLHTEEKFDQKYDRIFFDSIKKGVPDMGMEAFGASLSDEQIWALVVHIREDQARALRAAKGSPRAVNGVYPGKRHSYTIETVLDKGLKTPWAIDWLKSGEMLVTNRPGSMMLVGKDGSVSEIQGVPAVAEIGQGGLMEVAVHPTNGWIYLTFTDPSDRGGMTKLVRGKLKGLNWTEQETLFQAMPQDYSGSGVHFGSRIVFDGKGHLFFSIGERGNGNLAQDLTKPNGKIFRLNEDGSTPDDNPFSKMGAKVLRSIWSYGHRNPQGLVLGLDGTLWDTEHGPRGGDEVNKIVKGGNYGWPNVAFSINYNDTPYKTPWPGAGQDYKLPVFRWLPSIGACGLDVARGAEFPEWKGDLLAGGLSGANVDRIRISGEDVVEREELIHGMGRVRDVSVAPDGSVYVALNGPDKIIRVRRAK